MYWGDSVHNDPTVMEDQAHHLGELIITSSFGFFLLFECLMILSIMCYTIFNFFQPTYRWHIMIFNDILLY
jgi:hypothetical protein